MTNRVEGLACPSLCLSSCVQLTTLPCSNDFWQLSIIFLFILFPFNWFIWLNGALLSFIFHYKRSTFVQSNWLWMLSGNVGISEAQSLCLICLYPLFPNLQIKGSLYLCKHGRCAKHDPSPIMGTWNKNGGKSWLCYIIYICVIFVFRIGEVNLSGKFHVWNFQLYDNFDIVVYVREVYILIRKGSLF